MSEQFDENTWADRARRIHAVQAQSQSPTGVNNPVLPETMIDQLDGTTIEVEDIEVEDALALFGLRAIRNSATGQVSLVRIAKEQING
jgi:hypothetical protein